MKYEKKPPASRRPPSGRQPFHNSYFIIHTFLLRLPFPVARGFTLAALSLALSGSLLADGLPQWRKQLATAQDAKDPDAIIELTRRIITADPRDSAAWTALVQAEIKNQDYDRALACLDAWEKRGRSAQINDLRGDIFLAQDRSGDAEKAWQASLAIKPADYRVLSKLADLLETQERWPEVLALRTRAAAAKPTAALLAAKAGALLHAHQWDAANAAIQKANKLDATDETVQKWLPLLEQATQVLPRLKALDTQIAATPKDPAPLLDQAAIFSRIGQPAMALFNAKRALALAPWSVRALVQAGEAQQDLGQPAKAARFKVSHDLVRGTDGHVTLPALRELQIRDEAVLTAVLKSRGDGGSHHQEPETAQALAARSKALRSLNQYVLALEDARAALRLDANSPAAEFELGHDLDALGKPGEALPHIVHSTELQPGDPVAWYYRGVIEANRADFQAAVDSQTHSLQIRESAVALGARRDAELRLNMQTEAQADSARLHQLDPNSSATP